ncbi:hypothetical protein [Fibrella aquatica]|uniref:hypothetical protein n=1 Tax=Fibrella aquatica TaxID=3242487 RepID=UPI0035206E5B
MVKNTITGSMLAKLFPSMSKYFLENASQEQVNQAEQEAAVIHQQLEAAEKPGAAADVTPEAVVAAVGSTIAALPALPDPKAGALDIVALTKRATDAEASVASLQGKLTAAEADRDRYKVWYEKQAAAGTSTPGADASTREQAAQEKTLSAADAHALSLLKRNG